MSWLRIFLAPLLLLGACANNPDLPAPLRSFLGLIESPSGRPASPMASATTPAVQANAATSDANLQLQGGADRPAATIDANSLKNLNSTSILSRYGRPYARRVEGTREVWQFRSRVCVMLLHFRSPNQGGDPIVDHVDLLLPRTSAQGTQPMRRIADEGNCLRSFSQS